MKIGVPKEIKPQENRVGLTPAAVYELARRGHTVYVQRSAGEGSQFSDAAYTQAGATILDNLEAVYEAASLIVKVKEPLEAEYGLLQAQHTLFTYLHLVSSRALTEALMHSQALCVAYETVESKDGRLPLLLPMSEVAGRMSIQQGARCLERHSGGYGVLLGGVTGVSPAKVLIVGGGVVGTEAAKVAAGMGAQVTLLDKNLARLRYLRDVLPANVQLLCANHSLLSELIQSHHLVIGAVLVTGAKAPHIITKEMISTMPRGAVLVDVSVDQGGCAETSRPTTHEEPTYQVDGVLHYCVANMPGVVPHTSTLALTNATLPYVIQLADQNGQPALKANPLLRKGINIMKGHITYPAVSEAFDLPYTESEKLLNS